MPVIEGTAHGRPLREKERNRERERERKREKRKRKKEKERDARDPLKFGAVWTCDSEYC